MDRRAESQIESKGKVSAASRFWNVEAPNKMGLAKGVVGLEQEELVLRRGEWTGHARLN